MEASRRVNAPTHQPVTSPNLTGPLAEGVIVFMERGARSQKPVTSAGKVARLNTAPRLSGWRKTAPQRRGACLWGIF